MRYKQKYLHLIELLECLAFENLSGSAFPDEKIRRKFYAEIQRDIAARHASQQASSDPEQANDNHEEEAPAAPWAAVAAQEETCPGQPEIQLAVGTRVPHWQNSRLDFNQEARLTTPAQRREILRRDGYR